MSDSALSKLQNAVPTLRSKWWVVLLVLSLMLNLTVAGALFGRAFHGKQFGGQGKDNFVQLIPRTFFETLPDARRKELLQILRDNRDEFKAMRDASAAAALELATALENPTYDATAVKTIIDKFATGRESLAGKGGAVVENIISKLTPAERALLAAAIKDRAARGWK